MASNQTQIKQVGKFGLVGIINTLLDFGLYNLFTSSLVGFSLYQGNIFSTTIAMAFSFFANKRLVFKQEGGNLLKQAVVFVAVTGFGLWVLQNGVIKLLVDVWPAPLNLAYSIVGALGLDQIFSRDFVTKNGAKAFATLVSLTWNYLLYKKVVFKP